MEQQAISYLGEEKIGKLMLKFSIPCIMSLLVAALYNLVDQIFIGRGIGYLGNGATNVVYPVTIIALSLSLMIGDGCAAFLSLFQGMGDQENSHKSVGNSITLIVLAGVLLTVLFAAFREPILWSFGATENNIAYAREYYSYIILGLPFYMFANTLNSVIRADGSPKFAMISTLIGCLINVILDPIAIFVLNMGMMGAAVATVAGQIVSAALAFYYLFHANSFRLKRGSFRPRLSIIKKVIPLGGSSFLTQISIVVIMAVMNNVLVTYGAMSKYGADIPLTVVGIVMKVFGIVVSVIVGIAAGTQPIIGYNYGAGKKRRVRELFQKMMIAEAVVGLVAMLCFELIPLQIINIFGSGDALYQEFACLSFRIYLGSIILCAIQKSSSIFLQALGKPILSTSLSLLRDFVLSVPLVLILPLFLGVEGPLFSAPVADVISFAVTVLVMKHTMKSLTLSEPETEEELHIPCSFEPQTSRN